MEKELITLSQEEVRRLKILHLVMEGEVSQVKASDILGISDRQVRNILARLREEGDRGIAHGNRGRASPRRMSLEREDLIAEIVGSEYSDFGPTLASEKLLEVDGIEVSREKLRQIMLKRGIWTRRRKRRREHRWRERKSHLGEMVQMDGSHHDWLEERGPELVLMGYVDDATGRFFGRFYDYEGLFPAMDSLEGYIRRYGCPVNLYLDKHSTYKTTRQADLDELLRGEEAQTQFERAARELGIRVLHANSPQAKGRIERTFKTLQDRLVKELRLAGISTKEEANTYLEAYMPRYNERFLRPAQKRGDLHTRLPRGLKYRDVLCIKAKRVITNDYTISWRGRRFQIDKASLALRKQKVEVREHFDGSLDLRFKGRTLEFHEVFEVAPKKTKKPSFKPRKKYIPPPDHPWKRRDPSIHHSWNL